MHRTTIWSSIFTQILVAIFAALPLAPRSQGANRIRYGFQDKWFSIFKRYRLAGG